MKRMLRHVAVMGVFLVAEMAMAASFDEADMRDLVYFGAPAPGHFSRGQDMTPLDELVHLDDSGPTDDFFDELVPVEPLRPDTVVTLSDLAFAVDHAPAIADLVPVEKPAPRVPRPALPELPLDAPLVFAAPPQSLPTAASEPDISELVPVTESALAARPIAPWPELPLEAVPSLPAVGDEDLVALPAPLPELRPAPAAVVTLRPPSGAARLMEAEAKRIQSLCDDGHLEMAVGVFEEMPAFGDDPAANKFKADAINLLVLDFCRENNLEQARRLYAALPGRIAGREAMVSRARVCLNLATYYIRNDLYNEGYEVFCDIGDFAEVEEELGRNLFRMAARMIPYLDNAGKTDKAQELCRLLARQVDSAKSAGLLAECLPGLARYLLGRPGIVNPRPGQRERLEMMRTFFDLLDAYDDGDVFVSDARLAMAEELLEFYAKTGDRDGEREMRDIIAAGEAAGEA